MTTYWFRSPLYLVILAMAFIQACSGQVASTPAESPAIASKPAPKIVGPLPKFHSVPDPDTTLVSQYIRCIFQDSKGNYWFGPAGQSVARYDGETLTYFSREEFFEGNDKVEQDYGNSVHAIAEDTNGHLWFGTNLGAVKYDGTTFRSYTEKHGLTSTRVSRKSILTDRKGTVWVGTLGGVFQYIPSADTAGGQCFAPFPIFPLINVKDIMEDNAGNLWFASETQGIYRYDGADITNFSEQEGLGDNYAGGMAQDQEGNYWFLMKDGICRYDGNSFTNITGKDGLAGTEFWGICMEHPDIIWVTARGSTTRFDPKVPLTHPEAFTVFTPDDGLNCCVQSMYQDRKGNMWWGAGQGLYRFDGKNFYQVKQAGPW